MSNAIDDKELDDYLSGDTQYSRRYHAITADAVPPELDSLVLENAKEKKVVAIGTATDKRTSTLLRSGSLGFWIRLGVPITLAASVVFSLTILLENSVRDSSTPAVRLQKSDAEDLLPTPQVSVQQEPPVAGAAPQNTAQEKRGEVTRQDQESIGRLAEAAAKSISSAAPAMVPGAQAFEETKKEARASAMPSAQPASAASPTALQRSQPQNAPTTELDEVTVTAQFRRSAAEDAALPVSVITSEELEKAGASSVDSLRDKAKLSPRKQAALDAKLAKQQREANADSWLIYIRELRTAGKTRAANQEWKRFVNAYPNYSVDEADNARPKK